MPLSGPLTNFRDNDRVQNDKYNYQMLVELSFFTILRHALPLCLSWSSNILIYKARRYRFVAISLTSDNTSTTSTLTRLPVNSVRGIPSHYPNFFGLGDCYCLLTSYSECDNDHSPLRRRRKLLYSTRHMRLTVNYHMFVGIYY